MRLSRASTYAVYGAIYLAGQPVGRLVPLSEIRKQWHLPEKHLAKIFQSLVRSGHLRAVRGVHGGFALAKPAHSISVLDIIHVIEGDGNIHACPRHPVSLEAAPCCPIAGIVSDARAKMEEFLAQVSLAELAPPSISPPPT